MKLTSLVCLVLVLAACGQAFAPAPVVEFATPESVATAYFNAKIAGDKQAVQNTFSRSTPPAFDMAEGVDPPAGEASGYKSFRLLTNTPGTVDTEVTFNDGTKANRRLFVQKEGENYRISNYVWIP